MNKNRTNCVVVGTGQLGRVTDIGYCKERSLTFPRGLCSVQSSLNGYSLAHSSFYKYTRIIDTETRNIAQGKRASERARERERERENESNRFSSVYVFQRDAGVSPFENIKNGNIQHCINARRSNAD